MYTERILIVEDEMIIAQDAKVRIEKLGYTVCEIARSGDKAIQYAQELQPDLILMDILLKGKIDGIEATEYIHANLNIPVVYVTAHADENTLERAKKTAPYGYIIKPFHDNELQSVIEMALYKYQIEKKLKESEEKYRNLYDFSNDAIFLHDLNGTILDVNQKTVDLFGYSRKEIITKNILNLHPPDVLDDSKKVFRQIQKDGYVKFEIDFKKKSRERFSAEVSSSLFEISGKKVIQGIVRDITERKLAEKALKQSEEKFRLIVNTIPYGIIEMDTKGKIVFSSNPATTILGFSQKELKGKTMFDFMSLTTKIPDVKKAFLTIFKDRPRPVPYDFNLKRRDGKAVDIKVDWNYKKNSQGDVIGVVSVITDITKQKQSEIDLRESEERYRSLFEQANDAIYLIGPKTATIVDCNSMASKMDGYPIKELKGMKIEKLHPKDEIEKVAKRFSEVSQKGREEISKNDIILSGTCEE